jgi:predicted PurR-regulated permease PerM
MESEEQKIPAADRHLWQFPAVRDLLLLLLVIVLFWLFYELRHILLPILVALLLAYLVNPFLTRMRERWGVSRRFSIFVIFLLFIALCSAAVIWVAPLVTEQSTGLVKTTTNYLQELGERYGLEPRTLTESVTEQIQKPEEGEPTLFQLIAGILGTTTHILLWLLLVPVYFAFFAWRFQHMVHEGRHYLPPKRYPRATVVLRRMDEAVGTFFRARLLICLIIGVVFAVGWSLANVPYWFLLGAITGLLSIVPYLSIGGWFLALLFKYLELTVGANAPGYNTAAIFLWPTVVFAFGNFLEAWILTPWIHGRTTRLQPMVILSLVLIGGELGGFWGLLLAIPVAICLDILAREFLLPRLRI